MNGSLYECLGVSRDADTSEIKKAFKKLAMTHHPDKGGDPEEFKKIQHAHEVLSDENKRKMYDMTGSDSGEMPQGNPFGGGMPFGMGGMPFDMGDLFGGMFGMGGGPPPGMKVRRAQGPPKTIEIPLSLKDYYVGRTLEVKFERNKFCSTCKGEGATSFQTCDVCKGAGRVRQIIAMGPIQMVNDGPCQPCNGSGKKASGACYVCGGKKVMAQEKSIQVKIDAGMKPGEVLVFPKECSDDPNYEEPGDVHLVLQEAAGDEGWVRRGDDLETQVSIQFQECLLGCSKTLQGHPGFASGLEIQIPVGTQHGEVLAVAGKGMPKKGTQEFGSLRIRVMITVSEKERQVLRSNAVVLRALFL
jgi:DnaJ family protein A protein 2